MPEPGASGALVAWPPDVLGLALEHSPVGLAPVGPGGSMHLVNAALCAYLERDEPTLLSSTWRDVTLAEDLDIDGPLVDEMWAGTRGTYRVLKRYVRPSGAVVWGDLAVSSVRDPDGSVVCLICQIVDATEREVAKAEQALFEERYRLMAECANIVLWTMALDGTITYVSPTVQQMRGLTVDEAMHQSIEQILTPRSQAIVAEYYASLYAEMAAGRVPRPFRCEQEYLCKDGSTIWTEVDVIPYLGPDGEVVEILGITRDIDDLMRERLLLKGTLDSMLDPHVLLRAVRSAEGVIIDFRYEDANDAACADLGLSRQAVIGRMLFDARPGQSNREMLDMCSRVIESGDPMSLDSFPSEGKGRDSDTRYLDVRAVKVGERLSFTWRDVTERQSAARRLVESEERYRLLAENSSDVVMVSRNNEVVWVSKSLTRMLGWQPEDWVGHSLAEFGNPEDQPTLERVRAEIALGEVSLMRLRLADSTGTWRWVEVHAQAYRDGSGRVDGIQSSFRTVDREIEAEGLLARRATYDDLTGALKRDVALDRLHEIGQHSKNPGQECGILFIDVDDFKAVNDAHGHSTGDALLRLVVERIRGCIRTSDAIARMGGDEFLVILGGMHDLDEAATVAEKVRESCARELPLGVGPARSSVSIGVTLSGPIESGDAMIARADTAMYEAKRAGRNRVKVVPFQDG